MQDTSIAHAQSVLSSRQQKPYTLERSGIMRFRRITLPIILVAVLASIAVLVPPAVQEAPQVRLVRIASKATESGASLRDTGGWLTAGILDSRQEVWSAEFEIRNPVGSGIVLSHGDVGVELLGADGDWTAIDLPQPLADYPWLESAMRIHTRRVKLSVPSETRRCRFAIRFRPVTVQERCQQALARWGLWRRFPKLSAWISDWMPKSERWMECRPEVELPRVPIEQEAL
jgi:hypothetical protein